MVCSTSFASAKSTIACVDDIWDISAVYDSKTSKNSEAEVRSRSEDDLANEFAIRRRLNASCILLDTLGVSREKKADVAEEYLASRAIRHNASSVVASWNSGDFAACKKVETNTALDRKPSRSAYLKYSCRTGSPW